MIKAGPRPSPQAFDISQAAPPPPEPPFDAETLEEDNVLSVPVGKRRRFPFFKLIVSALFGIGITLLIDGALGRLFLAMETGSPTSWVLSGLYALLLLSLVGLALREVFGLSRLGALSEIRTEWSLALATGEDADAIKAVNALKAVLKGSPQFKAPMAQLDSYESDIMSGPDRLKLAERLAFAEADEKARRLILSSAQRATVVTAVSPRALLDIAYVAYESFRLITAIARTYGARPTASSLMRLVRMTLGNLAVTGGIAVTDGLLEQALGHGAAAKLSRRFGEGVLNGFLISRIGLAAILAARPAPFDALPRPKISDLARALLRKGESR